MYLRGCGEGDIDGIDLGVGGASSIASRSVRIIDGVVGSESSGTNLSISAALI